MTFSPLRVPWAAAAMLVLAGLIAFLPSMAYATPPDQTWIGGFYDNADFDDVVLLIVSALGLADSQPIIDVGIFLPPTTLASAVPDVPVRTLGLAVDQTRAPPLV